VRRPPRLALAVDETAPREKFQNVVPRLEDLSLEGLAAADHIADAFFGRGGDAHCGEFTRAIEPRELRRVVLVVFSLHARLDRDERGRDDVTRIAPLA
jgi:hypothetical protein